MNADPNHRTRRPTKAPQAKKRAAGRCACGKCWAWPEPDPVGRRRCTGCGCFTFAPDRLHRWCAIGWTAYLAENTIPWRSTT